MLFWLQIDNYCTVLVVNINSFLTGCYGYHCCYSNHKSFKSGIAVIATMKEKLKVLEIHSRLVLPETGYPHSRVGKNNGSNKIMQILDFTKFICEMFMILLMHNWFVLYRNLLHQYSLFFYCHRNCCYSDVYCLFYSVQEQL